jgi:hypothetical protein
MNAPAAPATAAGPRSASPIAALHDAATIRARCAAICRAATDGRTGHFKVDRSRLVEAARRVADATLQRYPDLCIPRHGCWRQFESGGVDRKAELEARLEGRATEDAALARIDLAVISVLLGSSAGSQWRYTERPGVIEPLALPAQRQRRDDLLAMLEQAGGHSPLAAAALPATAGTVHARSEGLAVAAFHAFVEGVFSDTDDEMLRADARALERLDTAALRAVFQVSPTNMLVGLEGRAEMLRRLGRSLQALARHEGGLARPARIYAKLTQDGTLAEITAAALLREILTTLAPVWPSGSLVQGLPAGDVWPHAFAGGARAGDLDRTTSGWVPLHMVGQRLAYSLIEPFEWAGVKVTGIETLTGLADHRNGGLLLDSGVIVPRDARDLSGTWKPGSDFVIEWRALTVALLDELAAQVRELLGRTAEQLPLASILEGGSWAAGRAAALELRGGEPPLKIDTDGTLF